MQYKKEYDIFEKISKNYQSIEKLKKIPAMMLVSEKNTIIELLKSFQEQLEEIQKQLN